MEFIADWQTINNPNMLTHIGIAAAIVITGTLAVPIYRTAKKTNRIKPQSFLLLILPATLIFGGTQLDDVRSDRHQQQLAASGVTNDSWAELEALIKENYNVSKVTPAGDEAATLDAVKAAAAGSTNVSSVTDPKVTVQHPDSTYTGIYRIIVTPSATGTPDTTLARQQSMEMMNEGIDPEAFRIK